MFQNNEDRIVHALESIAESQMKQTQIAEESFKEAKELRDITMGMMTEDRNMGAKMDKIMEKKLKSKEYEDDLAALLKPDSNTMHDDEGYNETNTEDECNF